MVARRAAADSTGGMIRRLISEEGGQALVLAMASMIVLAFLATAVTVGVTVNHQTAQHSVADNKAFALAELGLAYAEGRVYSAASTHVTPATGQTSFSQDGGSGTYQASVAADGITWTMNGT